jgi:hypothetical protein
MSERYNPKKLRRERAVAIAKGAPAEPAIRVEHKAAVAAAEAAVVAAAEAAVVTALEMQGILCRAHERRQSMPRELAMHAAWKHYFTRSAGAANGTTAPMDKLLAQILGGSEHADQDTITERDWYVATTVVQWLATNVGQCILFDAGYKYEQPKKDAAP